VSKIAAIGLTVTKQATHCSSKL